MCTGKLLAIFPATAFFTRYDYQDMVHDSRVNPKNTDYAAKFGVLYNFEVS